MRSWNFSTAGLAAVVMMAKESTTSPSGEVQRDESPAKANDECPRWKWYGCLWPLAPVNSRQPVAGIKQRAERKAARQSGFCASSSERALNEVGSSLSGLL